MKTLDILLHFIRKAQAGKIEGVLCLQFLSGLDPRGAGRLRWTRKLSQKIYTFLSFKKEKS